MTDLCCWLFPKKEWRNDRKTDRSPSYGEIDSVTCGGAAGSKFDVTPTCSLVRTHTRITCLTPADLFGAEVEWVVTVGGQRSVSPQTSVAAPLLRVLSLSNRTSGAPLLVGGEQLAQLHALTQRHSARDDGLVSINQSISITTGA